MNRCEPRHSEKGACLRTRDHCKHLTTISLSLALSLSLSCPLFLIIYSISLSGRETGKALIGGILSPPLMTVAFHKLLGTGSKSQAMRGRWGRPRAGHWDRALGMMPQGPEIPLGTWVPEVDSTDGHGPCWVPCQIWGLHIHQAPLLWRRWLHEEPWFGEGPEMGSIPGSSELCRGWSMETLGSWRLARGWVSKQEGWDLFCSEPAQIIKWSVERHLSLQVVIQGEPNT